MEFNIRWKSYAATNGEFVMGIVVNFKHLTFL